MDSGIIGGLSAVLVVPLIFLWLSRSKSFRLTIPEGVTLPELEAKYRSWQLRETLLMLLFVPVCVVLIYAVLSGAAGLVYRRPPGSVYSFTPDGAIWWIFALLWGIFLASVPMYFLFLRWMGKEAYEEYQLFTSWKMASTWGTAQNAVDSKKFGKVLIGFMGAITLFFLPLTLDYFTYITPGGITINRFFSLGTKTYTWTDVQQIKNVISFRAPNGKPIRNPYYEVTFTDGTTFSSRHTAYNWSNSKEQQVFGYIAGRSRKPVVVENPFPNARPVE